MTAGIERRARLSVSPIAILRAIDRWLLSAAPAERLAALRILVGGFVVTYLLAVAGEFRRVTRLPAEYFEPVGVAGLLNGPVKPEVVWTVFALAVVSGAGFMAGLAFRLSGPVFALTVLAWASYHSSWGQMLHFEHLITLHVFVLGLSPAAADCWAVDSARSVSRKRSTSSIRYGWPIRLLALITAVTYVVAAIAKLRTSGLEWVNTTTLGNHIAYSATRMDLLGARQPPLASFVVGKPWLISSMAWSGLLVEILAPLALLGKRVRNIWVVAALGMHFGTAATMLVWFPYHGLGFAMLPLFPVERVFVRLRRIGMRTQAS